MYFDWDVVVAESTWYAAIKFPAGGIMAVPFSATASKNSGPVGRQRHGRPIAEAVGDEEEIK